MTTLIIVVAVLVVAIGLFATVTRTRGRSTSRGSTGTRRRDVRDDAPPGPTTQSPGAPAPAGTAVSSGTVRPTSESTDAATLPGINAPEAVAPERDTEPDTDAAAPSAPRIGDRLGRARQALASTFAAVRGRARVDQQLFDELEEALIVADVGLATTTALLEPLRAEFKSQGSDPEAVLSALKRAILAMFVGDDETMHLAAATPSVWLFVGVNGVGKTTTIGKLARQEIAAGRSLVLAAGDTFRAAAGEQLAIWAERTNADIVQGADGADPSSVIFDAIAHASAIGADLVLADTAGRLHNKANLMEELKKVRRIADRPPGNVTEVLLVIDATTGQNGLAQAREFQEAVGVTGVVLTKLDGSAKGGIVLAIRAELGLPIKLVGLGEGVADLVPFDAQEFADALFS